MPASVSQTDDEQALRARGPSLGREVALAGGALAALGAIVLATHVLHGGFYADDWSNAALYRDVGYAEMATHTWRDLIPWRPVLAFLLPVPHALFGLDAGSHLAAAAALGVITSLSFFLFLRTLGVELPHALALALLSLVFPWSDALRLWATGSLNNVALVTYFLGSVATLRALRTGRAQPRRRVLLHALGAGLYVVSVVTYEVAAPAILLSGLLYRSRLPWQALRTRWLVDAALVLVPLAVLAVPASRTRGVGSPTERAADVPEFVVQASSLFASTFLPRNATSAGLKLLVLAAAAVVVGVALRRVRRRRERQLETWLLRAAAGICAAGLGYVMLLGYGLEPLSEGLENRVNTFSAFGFVVATYSVLALLALLVRGSDRRGAAALLATGAVLVGLGFVQRMRDDIAHYDASAAQQSDQLATLRHVLPVAPHGSTIFTFGHRTVSAPGVPIFSAPWVLTAAVGIGWSNPSLEAVPVAGKDVVCARSEARVAGFDRPYSARYGRALFVDLSAARARRIESRHDCLEALAVFRPRRGNTLDE